MVTQTHKFRIPFSILATKPVKQLSGVVGEKKKTKDGNRGFKTDISGKLIIEEPKRGGSKLQDSDSDEEIDEDENEKNDAPADESDSEDEATENARAKMRKRKASSALSQASGKTGKTGASSKYVAGGKGIHRPLNGAASVRSGYSHKTAGSKAPSTATGTDYRSKKAKGDIKKKGAVDPYAYIPLSRNTLNKRKRAKNSGQFKNIVQGARKGAAAGAKRRKI